MRHSSIHESPAQAGENPGVSSYPLRTERRPHRASGRFPALRLSFWIPILLLAASAVSTAGSGARLMLNFLSASPPLSTPDDFFPLFWVWHHPHAIRLGWSFSLALLAILLAHEAGHLVYCRKHGIRASLPYVLPAPTLSGTAGAVIRIRSSIPDRDALIEVGIAGPIAGYVVALGTAILGILLSRPETAATPRPMVTIHQPLTMMALERTLAAIVPGISRQILPHPVLMASWIGFFITSLNLIPAGQLDGGHILYAISPRLHRVATFAVPVALAAFGLLFWMGWLLWGAILLLPAMRHPRVPAFPHLRARHLWLGFAALALLALTFLPAPFAGTGLLSLLR